MVALVVVGGVEVVASFALLADGGGGAAGAEGVDVGAVEDAFASLVFVPLHTCITAEVVGATTAVLHAGRALQIFIDETPKQALFALSRNGVPY
jgi:hypothetical protein